MSIQEAAGAPAPNVAGSPLPPHIVAEIHGIYMAWVPEDRDAVSHPSQRGSSRRWIGWSLCSRGRNRARTRRGADSLRSPTPRLNSTGRTHSTDGCGAAGGRST